LARTALIFAILAGLVWIAALFVALAALATGIAVSNWAMAALLALAASGPAIAGIGAWALLMSGERLERRLARLERIAAADSAAGSNAQESSEALARAMASAARDALDAERGAMARRLAEIGEAQRLLGMQLDQLAALPGADAPVAPPAATLTVKPTVSTDVQPKLPLDGGAAAEPAAINWPNVAIALDFPKDANDARGFAALRTAVRHRVVADVLQGAEDILTILGQDGLYMEDMTAAQPPLDTWRAYLEGARGREVAAICGVEDEEAETRIRARMQSDPIFRDTAMHLIRRFDAMLRRAFAECRSDASLRSVIDNRTGRAFMLIA